MKKHLILIGLLWFITSCVKNTAEKPANLLTHQQMEDLIKDFTLSKAIPITQLDSLLQKDPNKGINRMQAILDAHKIKYSDFKESHEYYVKTPNEYNEIIAGTLESIEKDLVIAKANKQKEESIQPNKPIKEPIKRTDKMIKDSILRKEGIKK